MVKFSSLIQFREYIEKLPLRFIVTELIRVKTASKKDLLRPAPLLGLDAITHSLEDLVGKTTFKLFSTYSDQVPMIATDTIFKPSLNPRDNYKQLILYCTYYHDVDDVWMIPFQVDAILGYRESPLITIGYPTNFYEYRDLSLALSGTGSGVDGVPAIKHPYDCQECPVLAIRLLLEYVPSLYGGIQSQILKYGVLKQDARTNTGARYLWDTELDYLYRYGKVTDWFTNTDSSPRTHRESFEQIWLQGLLAGYQPFIYDQGYDLDILPDFTLMVDLGVDDDWVPQYYLLFNPLQSATLNYPKGDFAII